MSGHDRVQIDLAKPYAVNHTYNVAHQAKSWAEQGRPQGALAEASAVGLRGSVEGLSGLQKAQ